MRRRRTDSAARSGAGAVAAGADAPSACGAAGGATFPPGFEIGAAAAGLATFDCAASAEIAACLRPPAADAGCATLEPGRAPAPASGVAGAGCGSPAVAVGSAAAGAAAGVCASGSTTCCAGGSCCAGTEELWPLQCQHHDHAYRRQRAGQHVQRPRTHPRPHLRRRRLRRGIIGGFRRPCRRHRRSRLRARLPQLLQHSRQRLAERSRGLKPRARILGQRHENNLAQPGRQRRVHIHWRLRRLRQMCRHDAVRVRRVERPLPGHKLVQRHPQRIEVRTSVERLPVDLLRRHVIKRTGRLVRLGQARIVHDLRDAEIHQFHNTRGSDHDVGRLDVAMHDSARVRVLQRFQHLHRHPNRVLHWDGALRHPAIHCSPLHELHDHQQLILKPQRRPQPRDVRMLQRRLHFDLPQEPVRQVRVRHQVRQQYLHGFHTVRDYVADLENLPHSARAEFGQYLVIAGLHSRLKTHGILAF
jgi:hypothetical protein